MNILGAQELFEPDHPAAEREYRVVNELIEFLHLLNLPSRVSVVPDDVVIYNTGTHFGWKVTIRLPTDRNIVIAHDMHETIYDVVYRDHYRSSTVDATWVIIEVRNLIQQLM